MPWSMNGPPLHCCYVISPCQRILDCGILYAIRYITERSSSRILTVIPDLESYVNLTHMYNDAQDFLSSIRESSIKCGGKQFSVLFYSDASVSQDIEVLTVNFKIEICKCTLPAIQK